MVGKSKTMPSYSILIYEILDDENAGNMGRVRPMFVTRDQICVRLVKQTLTTSSEPSLRDRKIPAAVRPDLSPFTISCIVQASCFVWPSQEVPQL